MALVEMVEVSVAAAAERQLPVVAHKTEDDTGVLPKTSDLAAMCFDAARHPLQWDFRLVGEMASEGLATSLILIGYTALLVRAIPWFAPNEVRGVLRKNPDDVAYIAFQSLIFLDIMVWTISVYAALIAMPWCSYTTPVSETVAASAGRDRRGLTRSIIRSPVSGYFWVGFGISSLILIARSIGFNLLRRYSALSNEELNTIGDIFHFLGIGGAMIAVIGMYLAVGHIGKRARLKSLRWHYLRFGLAGFVFIIGSTSICISLTGDSAIPLLLQQPSSVRILVSALFPVIIGIPLMHIAGHLARLIGRTTGDMMSASFSMVYPIRLLQSLVQRFIIGSLPTLGGAVVGVATASFAELLAESLLPWKDYLVLKYRKRLSPQEIKTQLRSAQYLEFTAAKLLAKDFAEYVAIPYQCAFLYIYVAEPENPNRISLVLGQIPGEPIGPMVLLITFVIMLPAEILTDLIGLKVVAATRPLATVWGTRRGLPGLSTHARTSFVLTNALVGIVGVAFFRELYATFDMAYDDGSCFVHGTDELGLNIERDNWCDFCNASAMNLNARWICNATVVTGS